jgi:TonB family protein
MVAAPQAAIETEAQATVSPLVAQVRTPVTTQVATPVTTQVQAQVKAPLLAQASPQTTPPQAAPRPAPTQAAARVPVFTSSTSLVVEAVTVSDQDGKSVEGLGPSDFRIFEDDKAQAIVLFEFQKLSERSSYYILGYYAVNTNTDGSFRNIRIVVEHPGLMIGARTGYYADKVFVRASGGVTQGGTAPGGVDSNVVAGVTPPTPIYKVQPQYSEEARKAKFQGATLLSVDIDATGVVTNVTVIRPLGLGLDEKAVEAAKQWRFRPAMKDGLPVPAQAELEITFRLL